jgi:hypothetical protein
VLRALGFAGEVLRLVQVIDALQTGDGNRGDVADVEISMQTILEGKILAGGNVGDDQLRRQRLAHRDPVIGRELGKERRRRGIGQAEPQNDFARGRLRNLAQVPRLDAGEPVGGFPFARSEPRKNDRDAAANGCPSLNRLNWLMNNTGGWSFL